MNTVIPFVRRGNAASRSTGSEASGPRIIIFPGIRYERLDDAALAKYAPVSLDVPGRAPAAANAQFIPAS